MKRPSQRFQSNRWLDFLVPALLGLLFLSLVAVLVIVGLALF